MKWYEKLWYFTLVEFSWSNVTKVLQSPASIKLLVKLSKTGLVKLQASHFPSQKGIKRVLCKIAIDLSFVMNLFVYIPVLFFQACFANIWNAPWNRQPLWNGEHFYLLSSAVEVAKTRSWIKMFDFQNCTPNRYPWLLKIICFHMTKRVAN